MDWVWKGLVGVITLFVGLGIGAGIYWLFAMLGDALRLAGIL